MSLRASTGAPNEDVGVTAEMAGQEGRCGRGDFERCGSLKRKENDAYGEADFW